MSSNPLAQRDHTYQNIDISGPARVVLGSETTRRFDYDANGYRLVKIIDRGGSGIVTIVQHCTHPGLSYARKQLPKSRIKQEELEKEVALIREAEHRHVIQLVDTYEDEEWCYIVMLPVATTSLDKYLQHINSNRPTGSESWANFGGQRLLLFQWIHCLAVTLKELHRRNIRHRDIKPQNILIDGTKILLTDFGISFSLDGMTKVSLTTNTGTEKYEPPEALQESGDNTQRKIRTGRLGDVFSLGCVIFEMLGALSRPFPNPALPAVSKSYSSCVKNDDFLAQVGKMKEHEGLLRKRLPKAYQFVGLPEALLGNVMSGMMTPVESRKDSAVMVDLLDRSLKGWQVPLLDCCMRRSGAEIEDGALSQKTSDSNGTISLDSNSSFVEKNQSMYDDASDHKTTSAPPMTADDGDYMTVRNRDTDPLSPSGPMRDQRPGTEQSRATAGTAHDAGVKEPGGKDYFLPGESIRQDVLQHQLKNMFGLTATARPSTHQGTSGYLIHSSRRPTPEDIAKLKRGSRIVEDAERQRLGITRHHSSGGTRDAIPPLNRSTPQDAYQPRRLSPDRVTNPYPERRSSTETRHNLVSTSQQLPSGLEYST